MGTRAPAPQRVKSILELEAEVQVEKRIAPAEIISRIRQLPFAKIRPFINHPFCLYSGERLDDMVESIRKHGILVPLIVRRISGDAKFDYEMLSGHNRMNAGGIAGLDSALCLIKDDLTEGDAQMYVIETNLMQRSFADLLPSEKATVLAFQYSEMFSQGKRNDILQELEILEKSTCETSGNEFHKTGKSRDNLGQKYELTGRAVANYLSLDKLSEGLKNRVDNGAITLTAGVQLSFMDNESQKAVEQVLEQKERKINKAKAITLRSASQRAPLQRDTVVDILSPKKSAPATKIVLPPSVYSQYFSPSATAVEVEETIGKALALYFA